MQYLLLGIALIHVIARIARGQTIITSTHLQDIKQVTQPTNYTQDSVIGILILGILFALAYVTGRSGHRMLQTQIDQQLTQIRQTEDDNQLTEEKDIASALKSKQQKDEDAIIDTNELHLPADFSDSYWNMAVRKFDKALGQITRYRQTATLEKKQLTQKELYNQFEFEDSI